jgi:toxin-antitoxin system PIN domain toxin
LKLPDANLLLYAYDSTSPRHSEARAWFREALSEAEQVGLPWMVILAFLRISTSPRAFARPFSRDEAGRIVGEWLERPQVAILDPVEQHWEILQALIGQGQCSGALIMDAHLAALAIGHGATLYSADRDFARFPGLDLRNPVA